MSRAFAQRSALRLRSCVSLQRAVGFATGRLSNGRAVCVGAAAVERGRSHRKIRLLSSKNRLGAMPSAGSAANATQRTAEQHGEQWSLQERAGGQTRSRARCAQWIRQRCNRSVADATRLHRGTNQSRQLIRLYRGWVSLVWRVARGCDHLDARSSKLYERELLNHVVK